MIPQHFLRLRLPWRSPVITCVLDLSVAAGQEENMSKKRPAEDLYNDGREEPKKSLFQKEYKYFKSREKKPDLGRVIDFCKPELHPQVKRILNSELDPTELPDFNKLELHSFADWKIYTVEGKDGFYFICNPFTGSGQRTWIQRSIQMYPKHPAKTNIESGIWSVNGLPAPELRWCTFGYHHNWATKVYSKDDYSDFPPCLRNLCRQIARPFGFEKFEPEAAILHFYRLRSTLGGHIDYSELDRNAPLISISFGQSAVYLLGAEAKEEKPVALFIRSGDVVIMSRSCRFANHAVPLIVADDEYLERCHISDNNSESWQKISDYLKTKRVNVNVRQVFPN